VARSAIRTHAPDLDPKELERLVGAGEPDWFD
jgi:hypothetical protein